MANFNKKVNLNKVVMVDFNKLVIMDFNKAVVTNKAVANYIMGSSFNKVVVNSTNFNKRLNFHLSLLIFNLVWHSSHLNVQFMDTTKLVLSFLLIIIKDYFPFNSI